MSTEVRRGARLECLEPDCDERARLNRAADAIRAERIRLYEQFAAANGGRLGDDLAGILDGSREPSGEPAPEPTLPTRTGQQLLATEGCARCGRRRYRKLDPAQDDGLCGVCRAQVKQGKGLGRWRQCECCGRGRSTRSRDGLCAKCRKAAKQKREARRVQEILSEWQQQEASDGDGIVAGGDGRSG
jgi:hypothetical protein